MEPAEKTTEKRRYTLENNFEDVYLRTRTLKRYLDKADIAIMKDKETSKVIQHLADRQMGVYGKILQWNGFDREDIHSIVTLFAACFTGLGQEAKSKRDYYYLMMNFVNQRMEFFTDCVMRKFQVSDVVSQNVLSSGVTHDDGQSAEEWMSNAALKNADPVTHEIDESAMSHDEHIDFLEDHLEVIKLRTQSRKRSMTPEEVSELNSSISQITTVVQCFREEANKNKREDRALSVDLKKRFEQDPLRYADKLSYYATYKGISFDVRKAARLICKRHGIDFTAWAKARVADMGPREELHFDVR